MLRLQRLGAAPASRVAQVVPPLATILARAFTTSTPIAARERPPRSPPVTPASYRFGLNEESQPKPRKPEVWRDEDDFRKTPEFRALTGDIARKERRLEREERNDRRERSERRSDNERSSDRSARNSKFDKSGPRAQTTSKRLAPDFNKRVKSLPPGVKLPFEKPRAPKAEPLHRQKENVELSQPRRFSAFELYPGLQSQLETQFPGGVTTPIQSLALAHLIAPDVSRAILGAETGSGKTLAYLLPLLHHLKSTDTGPSRAGFDGQIAPRALILSPTHELTRQSTAVAKSFSHDVKLSVMGASSPGSVRNAGAIDLLFATGRSACSLLGLPRDEPEPKPEPKRKPGEPEPVKPKPKRPFEPTQILNLSRLEWLIIDEADVLLGPAFETETQKVLETIKAARGGTPPNILLVTATLPPSLLRAVETQPLLSSAKFDQYLSPGLHRLPKKLETRFVPWSKGGNAMADVAHEIKRVFADEAMEARLTKEGEGASGESTPKVRTMAVVFCGSVGKVAAMSKALESKSIPCLAWTGETAARNERPGHNGPLDAFLVQHRPKDAATKSERSPRVLVTTSLLSRGLDFCPAVTTTYLMDPPRNVLDFVHRAGRAGRAGRPGRVVVFGMSHAGQSKYADELRDVLGKVETRAAVKPGGRTWSGKEYRRSGSGGAGSGAGNGGKSKGGRR